MSNKRNHYLKTSRFPEETNGNQVTDPEIQAQYNLLEECLNVDETYERYKPSKKCRDKDICKNVLNRSFTKRQTRIAAFSGTMLVYYSDFEKLCPIDRTGFYNWYYDQVLKEKETKPTQTIFELKIKEDNAKDLYNSARFRYETMLMDYNYRRGDVTKTELESQKRHYENTRKLWEYSLKQLQKQLAEDEARKKGYPIDLPNKDNLK